MHFFILRSLILTTLISNAVVGDLRSQFKTFSNKVTSFFSPTDKLEKLQKLGVLPSVPECGVFREEQYFNLQQSAKSNEFPWVVTMIHLEADQEFMGVLISKNYILATAGWFVREHLKPSAQYEDYAILMENCYSSKCWRTHEVKYVGHTSYNGGFVAILNLREPIDRYTKGFQPICLPRVNERDLDFVGKHLLWTTHQYLEKRRVKQFVLIQPSLLCNEKMDFVVSSDYMCAYTCNNALNIPYNITGSMLMSVALNGSEPSHFYLVALQHKLLNFCLPGQPQVLERIDRLLNWILESIATEEKISI